MAPIGFGILFPLVIVGTVWCAWMMISKAAKVKVKRFLKKHGYAIGLFLGLTILCSVVYLGA